MKLPFWNLDKAAKLPTAPLLVVTGSIVEQAQQLIERCDERDAIFAERALTAERFGDHECCWFNMALREENKRFRERLVSDLAEMKQEKPTHDNPTGH